MAGLTDCTTKVSWRVILPFHSHALPLAAVLAAIGASPCAAAHPARPCAAAQPARPCAAAQPASFTLTPISISGNADFDAVGINKSGTIVGTLFDTKAGTQTAMKIVHGKTAVALPNPDTSRGPFMPRAINDAGDVLGYAVNAQIGNTLMFLLQGTAFNTAYSVPLVQPGDAQTVPPLPISLTDNLVVSYNTIYSIDLVSSSYGRPPKFHSVPPQNRSTHVNSVNASGMIAGISYSLNGITSVFTGRGKMFTAITPPNARNIVGGYINNAGTVAGSFEDNAGAWHGFTYAGGAVTVFDPPLAGGAANSMVTVNAINSAGRVVGSYIDSTGAQHGFLANGTTAFSFGTYAGADAVSVAINSVGVMVAANQNANNSSYQSATVTCSGSGC
jgi:hypothetical protein